MTHDEAKTKVCPIMLSRVEVTPMRRSNGFGAADHPEEHAYGYRRCCGNECAMWTPNAGSKTEGYCGLRGKVVIP